MPRENWHALRMVNAPVDEGTVGLAAIQFSIEMSNFTARLDSNQPVLTNISNHRYLDSWTLYQSTMLLAGKL